MRPLEEFFKYQMLKEAEMQNHPTQGVKETQTGPAAAEAAPQLKRKDEETTLKQLQEFLAVKQRETDQLKQLLVEAIQRLQMCQRQDQHCKEIEKLTEEMLKRQVAEKNMEATNTKARSG